MNSKDYLTNDGFLLFHRVIFCLIHLSFRIVSDVLAWGLPLLTAPTCKKYAKKLPRQEQLSFILILRFLIELVEQHCDPRDLADEQKLILLAGSGVDDTDDRQHCQEDITGRENNVENIINRAVRVEI